VSLKPIVQGMLEHVMERSDNNDDGALSDAIPALQEVDPRPFALAVTTIDGEQYCAGDSDVSFTIQSISKPFVYALALESIGSAEVLNHVDVEPSGDAFSELSLMPETGRPFNPMINAGAIAAHALVPGDTEERVDHILDLFSRLAGRRLTMNSQIYRSEREHADRNLGIAHMLRARGVIESDPESVVDGYIQQCSIEVTARDLSMMSATLANGGLHPVSGERILSPAVVRQTMSVMLSCGMYDIAGDWITRIGVPAKSGISGGVTGALPGQLGITAFSPRLGPNGSSVRGFRVFYELSQELSLHLLDAAPATDDIVIHSREGQDANGKPWRVLQVLGAITFPGAERILRELSDLSDEFTELSPENARLVVDLSSTLRINPIGRQLLAEAVRRIAEQASRVIILDPAGLLDRLDKAAFGRAELHRRRDTVPKHKAVTVHEPTLELRPEGHEE
jgi:glutaminase